jgi:hypothetical protein
MLEAFGTASVRSEEKVINESIHSFVATGGTRRINWCSDAREGGARVSNLMMMI